MRYLLLFVVAVIAVLGFKLGSVETHEAQHVAYAPLSEVSSQYDINIVDLNQTLSAANTAWLKTMIKTQMQFHSKHTPLKAPLAVKVKLWESHGDFKAYQRRISKNARSSKGFYSVSRKELVVNKSKPQYLKTLAHEAQHMLFRREGFRPPKWLNEGLSEYFEELTENTAGQKIVKEQRWRSQRLQKWLAEDKLPPLAQFLNDSSSARKARDKKEPYLSQTLSWGVVFFLMQTGQGREALLATIKDLKREKNAGDSARALNNHYPLNQLEQDFYAFISQNPSQHRYLW